MNIFNKLFEETLAQSVAQPAVVKGFSTDLKDKIATLSGTTSQPKKERRTLRPESSSTVEFDLGS